MILFNTFEIHTFLRDNVPDFASFFSSGYTVKKTKKKKTKMESYQACTTYFITYSKYNIGKVPTEEKFANLAKKGFSLNSFITFLNKVVLKENIITWESTTIFLPIK